jgi:hypothetical protein
MMWLAPALVYPNKHDTILVIIVTSSRYVMDNCSCCSALHGWQACVAQPLCC